MKTELYVQRTLGSVPDKSLHPLYVTQITRKNDGIADLLHYVKGPWGCTSEGYLDDSSDPQVYITLYDVRDADHSKQTVPCVYGNFLVFGTLYVPWDEGCWDLYAPFINVEREWTPINGDSWDGEHWNAGEVRDVFMSLSQAELNKLFIPLSHLPREDWRTVNLDGVPTELLWDALSMNPMSTWTEQEKEMHSLKKQLKKALGQAKHTMEQATNLYNRLSTLGDVLGVD